MPGGSGPRRRSRRPSNACSNPCERNSTTCSQKLAISPALTLESAEQQPAAHAPGRAGPARVRRVKRRRGGLDFDDLLVRTRDLLAGDPELGRLARWPRATAIEFVLVDEFQDTDRIQSEILRRLGDDAFFRGRMFVVGDAKQSIYRFRGAEPAIFDRWRGEFPEPGRLLLTENFRSVPGVIHFVNALFAGCFRRRPAGARRRSGGPAGRRCAAIRTRRRR